MGLTGGAVTLFIIGTLFAYFVIVRLVLHFFCSIRNRATYSFVQRQRLYLIYYWFDIMLRSFLSAAVGDVDIEQTRSSYGRDVEA